MSSTHNLSSACSTRSDDSVSTASSSMDASGRVVLVTGGAGFIGSHTAEYLLRNNDVVVVVDEMNDYYDLSQKRANLTILEDQAPEEGRLFVYQDDICDRPRMEEIFELHRPTHVVHLAARAGVRPSIDDPFIYVQTNVMGTVTLMELASKYKVQNFVYASSSSVYGGSKEELFSEEDIVDEPVSQYAASKKSCELFAATYNSLYGLNCTGLRFFTVYGPRGRPDMAPFKFIHRIMNGVTIDQYGDGSSERDYTYIDDIVNGIVLALERPLGNAVLNLGKGRPCKLSDFIKTCERICDKEAVINVMPMQPGDVPRTCADTTRARRLIGYEAQITLSTGLERTCAWYRDWQAQKEGLLG